MTESNSKILGDAIRKLISTAVNMDIKYQKLLSFLKSEIILRQYVCATNHAVLLDNAEKLLKEIGELE